MKASLPLVVSIALAFAGLTLAAYLYGGEAARAERLHQRFPTLHRVLSGKYYIDELYDAVVVRPIQAISTTVLWKGADAALIDGSVNGLGKAVQGTSAVLRRLQSGSIRAYAASIFLGVVVILGWYLLR